MIEIKDTAYFKMTTNFAALWHEYKCLKFLSSRLENVPKPLNFIQFEGHFALTTAALPGKPAFTFFEKPTIPFLQAILQKVHLFNSNCQTNYTLSYANRWGKNEAAFRTHFEEDYHQLLPRLKKAKAALCAKPLPAFYQHNDFNPWNSLWDGQNIYAVDFEDCHLKGLPAMDLFYFYIIGIYLAAGSVGQFQNEADFLAMMSIFKTTWHSQPDELFVFFCLERIAIDMAPKRNRKNEAERWVHLLRTGIESNFIPQLCDIFAYQALYHFYRSQLEHKKAAQTLERYHQITPYFFRFL